MLADLFASIIALIEQNPGVAYAAVFLLAMSEALPAVGIVVPGTAIILGLSALIPTGTVSLLPMLAATISGAAMGDGLSFWLGHRYQRRLLTLWPLSHRPDIVDRGEAFFARHGVMSVFFARFIPGVRAVVPLLAGVSGMPVVRFYVANVLSAVTWAVSHVVPAALAGAAVAQLGAAAKPIAVLLIVVTCLGFVAYHALRLGLRAVVPLVARWLELARKWAAERQSVSGKWASIILRDNDADLMRILVPAAILTAAAWLFLGILEDVVTGDPLVRADVSVYSALKALRTEFGDRVMMAITELGDTRVVVAVTVSVVLYLLVARARRSALYLAIAVGGGSILNTVIKVALHRTRPGDMAYGGWSEFSFPSGHSTVNATLYGFLAFLIARQASPGWRLPIAVVAATLALSIAFSRVYLGAHWFSDAAAGLSFATLWITALAAAYSSGRGEKFAPVFLAAVTGGMLLTAGGFNIYRYHAVDTARYAVRDHREAISVSDWQQERWRDLPARRIDLTGEIEEPFTLQVAGQLNDIKVRLWSGGWRSADGLSLHNFARLFGGSNDPIALPTMPLMASGRLPDLVMVMRASDDPSGLDRYVLRIWRADVDVLVGPKIPLWYGSAVRERLGSLGGIVTVSAVQPHFDDVRAAVERLFSSIAHVPRQATTPTWDGEVALLMAPSSPTREPQ